MLRPARALPVLLALVAVVVAVVLLTGGERYRVTMVTPDAGQLVVGNHVTVAGLPVGQVTAVRLARDRRAEVELRIDEPRWRPLPRTVHATIAPGGLAGQANRVVALEIPPTTDGASAATIPDGGAIDPANVRGIVDLDHLLASLDDDTRERLARMIRRADGNLARTGAGGNAALREASPAFYAVRDVLRDVSGQEETLDRLLRSTDALTGTLVEHEEDLRSGLASTRRVARTLVERRSDLADLVDHAPGLLREATATLRRARPTLRALEPTIAAAGPLVDPLLDVAARLRRATPALLRTIDGGRDLVRRARPLLDRVPAMLPEIDDGLQKAHTTFRSVRPLMTRIAPYVPDVLAGFTSAFAGASGGYYDANGMYARVSLNAGGGLLEGLPDPGIVPGLFAQDGFRTGRTNRCPGAAAPATADGSSPWVPSGITCDRGHDQ
ncbi:MAG: MlaD family protein [Solirubrobacteraceae bacterium]|nr:MlaD family protein [Solirubrobacteraceae bacterium]